MSGEARLWLPYERPPLSLNDRHGHHHARGRAVAQVRRDVGWLARAARLGRHDHVSVQLHYTPVRRGRRDADNLVATLKVVCDALVDVGLVVDDDPAHMTKPMPVIHRPDPNWSLGPHRLWLTITPGPAPAPTDGTPPGPDRLGGGEGSRTTSHIEPVRPPWKR